jgi:hypothetical protein
MAEGMHKGLCKWILEFFICVRHTTHAHTHTHTYIYITSFGNVILFYRTGRCSGNALELESGGTTYFHSTVIATWLLFQTSVSSTMGTSRRLLSYNQKKGSLLYRAAIWELAPGYTGGRSTGYAHQIGSRTFGHDRHSNELPVCMRY